MKYLILAAALIGCAKKEGYDANLSSESFSEAGDLAVAEKPVFVKAKKNKRESREPLFKNEPEQTELEQVELEPASLNPSDCVVSSPSDSNEVQQVDVDEPTEPVSSDSLEEGGSEEEV